jgi:glycosyltransferase involved in cell wall biosynthesis
MRVGITTSVIGRGKTGIAQYLFGLVRALAAHAEHRYTLFVLEGDAPLFEFARDYVTTVAVPEEIRPPQHDIWWHQRRLPALARELEIDVLHIPSYRRMVWTRRVPRVATIHDLAPCELSGKYNWPRMFYAKVVARALARRQEAIIAVSGRTARDIERHYGLGSEHVACVPNGIDHGRFRASGAPREDFLLYVARLEHPAKNHCRLIEAFTRFKARTTSNWKLKLAGSDWQNAEAIHEAARRSPFAADIEFLGFVADADLPALYQRAAVFIYPSLYEGFGLPPLEAMACGCPVIASDRGSLGEVVGGAARLIDPEDVNNMANTIASLWRDQEERRRLVALGFERAAEFDWAKTAAATVRVYERVAEAHHRGCQPTLSSLVSKNASN